MKDANWGFSCDTKYLDKDIIHKFQSGKILIQSQLDQNEHLTVLLKSLTPDTWFNFQKITLDSRSNGYILQGTMHVKSNSSICAGWVDIQPLIVEINPYPVDNITLTGKTIHQSENITVLVSECEI
jgi:hypothetical protein